MKVFRSILLPIAMACFLAACATTPTTQTGRSTGMDRVSPVRAAEINTRLGLGYLERGQMQIAMEKLHTALSHDPDHVPAHMTLGLIFEQLDDVQAASRHYRQAARLAPNDGATQNGYAVFLCRQGRYREAEEHFMTATRDPFYGSPEVAWTNAGACARRAGKVEHAESLFRQALERDSSFPDALFHLAEIYHQQGESFRARAFLQRLEAVSSTEPGALMLGYQIESELGNDAVANQYARRLEHEYPDSNEAKDLRVRQIGQ